MISDFCEVYGDKMGAFLEVLDEKDFLRMMIYFYVSRDIVNGKPISVRRMCMVVGVGLSIGHYVKNQVCNKWQKVFGLSNTNNEDLFREDVDNNTFAS